MDTSLLPLDLEREIFETTALLHPGTAPALLRVSRRVFIWIEPLLYRALRIDRSSVAKAIERAMHRKPPSFFRQNVRHLYLSPSSEWSQINAYALLRLCPRIVSLYVDAHWSQPALLPILEHIPHARMWCGSLRDLFGYRPLDLSHPFFHTITHLDIFEIMNYELNSAEICPALATLPALTHLCLNNGVPVGVLRRLLEQCAHLQVLVDLFHPSYASWARGVATCAEVTDARYVVAVRAPIGGWAPRATDLWAEADAFVARKRRGEIEVTRYWVEPWW